MLITAVVAGAVAWFLHAEWVAWMGVETIWLQIGEVFVPAMLALFLYWGITSVLGLKEARDCIALLRNKEIKD